jgi:hypothetical protein
VTSRSRELLSNLIVGIAIFLVVVWLLRRVVGLILWGASILALVVVMVALLALARWVRKG